MAKCNFIILLFIVICGIYLLPGCKNIDSKKTNSLNKILDTTGMIKALVIDYRDLDGCDFLLVIEKHQKLQPLNLPEEFKINNLEVYISYKRINQPSICMAGWVVHISKIIKTSETLTK